MPTPDDLLSELTKKYGSDFGLDFGDSEDEAKPPTTSQKTTILQNFVKILTDLYPNLDPSFATNFLSQNPDLVSQLYSNFDVTSNEGLERFSKILLDLEKEGLLGTNLGSKAGTLTTSSTSSSSTTVRTLSPSEAESIFNLELKFGQAMKQAPLEAAKFIGKNYVPEEWRGLHMPGFEEGGVYRNLLPGVDPKMFAYKPTGNINALADLFRPTENLSMQLARQAMQRMLETGISSTSTTSGGSTTSSMSQPMGGPAGPPASANALLSAYYAANPNARFSAPLPMEAPMAPEAAMPLPSAPPPQTNMLQNIWGFLNPFD